MMGISLIHRRSQLPGQCVPYAPPDAETGSLPKVRFHDLCHTFVTPALQNGVDIKTVSGMRGYFSTGFTANIHAHVMEEADQRNANILSSTFLKKA